MKKLLILLILVPAMCWGQKKDTTHRAVLFIDSTFTYYSSLFVMSGNAGTNEIILHADSTITIIGDTTKVLLMMFKYLKEYSDRLWAAKGVLDRLNLQKLKELLKSKDISSSVDYYLKTEKKYKLKR